MPQEHDEAKTGRQDLDVSLATAIHTTQPSLAEPTAQIRPDAAQSNFERHHCPHDDAQAEQHPAGGEGQILEKEVDCRPIVDCSGDADACKACHCEHTTTHEARSDPSKHHHFRTVQCANLQQAAIGAQLFLTQEILRIK